jgi:ferric-dicitrate binding protein FerR (iron transport regulator)
MKPTDSKILLDKYNSGNCTEEERAIVERWFLTLEDQGSVPAHDKIERMKDEVWQSLPLYKKEVRLWPRIAVAVAAVTAIIFGVWFYNSDTGVLKQVQDDVVVNDIAPGKNTATLTLANGKVITLSDAKLGVVVSEEELKYDDGTTLSGLQPSLPEGERSMMLIASTPRGGTYQITLPDGSKAWLNAASSIRFPASFSGLVNRKVVLDGEAYFEVSKNKKQPFVVETKNQDVTVLGTHFNVNAYDDEPSVKTTLLEGSVRVASLSSGAQDEIVLKPNQQAINVDSKIKVQTADIENELAWQKGDFVFADEDFKTTMRKIARWYDLEIVYDKSVPVNIALAGWVSRNSNLSTVLKRIELASKLHFTIEGRRVTVRK